MKYLDEYLKKYPKDENKVMSGRTIFGSEEMEDILETALKQNKKFILTDNEDDEVLDGQGYKLI
jgi:hypothetical protein